MRSLTRADFDIFEDGRAPDHHELLRVESRRATTRHRRRAAAAFRPARATEPDQRFRRKVLVLVDNRHTTRHGRDSALASSRR